MSTLVVCRATRWAICSGDWPRGCGGLVGGLQDGYGFAPERVLCGRFVWTGGSVPSCAAEPEV